MTEMHDCLGLNSVWVGRSDIIVFSKKANNATIKCNGNAIIGHSGHCGQAGNTPVCIPL